MPDQTQSEFLAELEQQNNTNPLEQPLTPEAEITPTEEEPDEEKFNRRERRLQAKLQAERESAIALAARLEALTEAQKFSRENTPEVDETIARIYGTNTPEAAEATALLQKALANAENRATEKALEKFREEQQAEQQSVQHEEQTLDGMIDDIEDETGVDMDPQTKKAFFSLLGRLSPKDSDGTIKEYADHHAVWEELQARKQPQNTRAKDLASRSVARNGASPATSVQDDATVRFLRENGII
jgi:hypothetical protein